MDLMDGAPVRLEKGDFDARTDYAADPAATLAGFAEAGAEWAHVVDLDGARAKQPRQHDTIRELALSAPLKLQVAGGFRSIDDVRRMLDAGAARVVIGSLAIREPRMVSRMLDLFGPEELALALDVKLIDGEPIVVTAGWTENSGVTLYDAAARFPAGCHLLLTDVGRDGMLQGPNFHLLEEAQARLPGWKIQASGGVATLDDLRALKTAGVVVGKALWERRFTLSEALDACT
jgi:phosphoribosylformimino-5-aminoimidazole carboxamide ribotide isomerase